MEQFPDIFADLKSPDTSVRFAALQRIEETGLNPEQQAVLKRIMESERDSNLRFQMQKIIAGISIGKQKLQGDNIVSLINIPNPDEMKLALMLESVKKSNAQEVRDALRFANWTKFSSKLIPSVLKFLKKYGDKADSDNIAAMFKHSDMRVITSAIEALERLNPELLKKHLVPLLLNSNLGIRARAIRLISIWDPPEAMRHFEQLLFSSIKEEKNVALFQSFFFPFPQIESLMLRFISLENDEELIKKAAVVFMANPDKQLPVKLMEIRQTCQGIKYALIDAIMKGVIDSLFKTGIVNLEPEKMLVMLERHFKEKQIKLFVEHFASGLRSLDPEVRLKSALKLFDAAKAEIPGVRELLEKYCEKEPEKLVREKVLSLLHFKKNNKTSIKKDYFSLEENERLQILSELDKDTFEEIVSLLKENISKISTQELVLLLKAIKKHGTSSDGVFVEKCLQSSSAEILIEAIDCLAVINPDTLHILLPNLINHRFDEVKIEAIKVFARFDKKQAISLLEKTLLSIKPTTRRSAIFCLGQFDFSSVGNILFSAIKREADPENLENIISVIKSNPDEDIFYNAYFEAKNINNPKKDYFEALYPELCKQLASQTGKSEKELYEAAETRVQEEKQSLAQKSSYKLEKIQKMREQNEKQPFWDESLIKFTIFAYSIGVILTLVIWFGFMKP
ncbi:MAG: HEAT repeat domain-containing protein [Candidatus Riflebacteria bacterium]|nr:HEAT repeat domain-containing protein [Candidatus Riflebacteria bacterium]